MTTISVHFSSNPAVFAPGGIIEGFARVQLEHPVKAKCARIVLEGRATTEWEVTEKSTESHSRSSLVPYSAVVDLAKEETVVWKADDSKVLAEGTHDFQFTFRLPEGCPPSFEGRMGALRYCITVVLERPWKTNKTFSEFFSVNPTFDLNLVQRAADPQLVSKTKNIGLVFFRYGKISLQCRLSKSGFVCGERLRVELHVENDSSRPILSAEASLMEVADYVAYRYGTESTRWHGTLDGEGSLSDNNRRTEERRVVKVTREVHIAPRQSQGITLELAIPPCVASFDTCPIIHTHHVVEVKIHAKGSINTATRCICPVVIGTVPVAKGRIERMMAIASYRDDERYVDLEPTFEPCQYLEGSNSPLENKFTPLVSFHSHLMTGGDTSILLEEDM